RGSHREFIGQQVADEQASAFCSQGRRAYGGFPSDLISSIKGLVSPAAERWCDQPRVPHRTTSQGPCAVFSLARAGVAEATTSPSPDPAPTPIAIDAAAVRRGSYTAPDDGQPARPRAAAEASLSV